MGDLGNCYGACEEVKGYKFCEGDVKVVEGVENGLNMVIEKGVESKVETVSSNIGRLVPKVDVSCKNSVLEIEFERSGYLVQGLSVRVGKVVETRFAKASTGQRGVRHCHRRTEEGGEKVRDYAWRRCAWRGGHKHDSMAVVHEQMTR